MSEEKPPMPPGMPAMPPMPPMPPGMPAMPPMQPADAPLDTPPAPPGMPPMPPMDAPPAPPGMPPMPPMPSMDAPPAPPGMPPMPSMDAPPAPPGMPPMPPMDAPPAPPEMPPMPPMDAPPAPPENDPLMSALSGPLESAMPPMDTPPAPPEMPPMPPMDAPVASPADLLLAPPQESNDAELVSEEATPATEVSPADLLLAPVADIPATESEAVQENMSPDDLSGEQAGATIRSRDDVEKVPGDKLEGSLHEIESATLNSDGEIVKQSVKGTLTINNPSADDRIYDIDVILDNAESTDIGGDHVSVDELEAGKKYSMKYKVEGMRMMALRERLDTNPARSQERSLSVAFGPQGGPIALELEVENMSNVLLENVEVVRPVPDEVSFNNTDMATMDGKNLVWNIGTLGAGEKQVLSVEGSITVTGTKTIKAGSASATYTANSTLSNLNFRELDAFCRGFTYMRVREDERPDNWICKTIFENRSSFAVDLVKLQVRMKGSNELLFDIHDVEQDVLPNGKWESEDRTVVANSEPDFTYDLSYTILPHAARSTEGSMKLEENVFDVLEAEVNKSYSTSGLRSYRNQKVNSSITLINKGSATINLMRITDDIPGLFDAPDLESMRISVAGTELETDQYKAEISTGITLEKEHRSPDGDGHTLTMTIGTRGPLGLAPGEEIAVSYDLIAPDPSPENKKVVAPLRAEFSAERFGPVCGRDCASPPSIKVIHNRRDFSAGKQAIPLGGKGRYEVLILFENNGDTALQDIYINDVIPTNFEIKDWYIKGASGKRDDCEMTTEDIDLGVQTSWMVPMVGKGERIEVCFEIKGSGEVDGDILNKFHGVHFGDEIESDELPEAAPEEVAEEVAEEAESSEDTSDEGTEDVAPNVTWREDVLLRVMESHEISVDDRDAFVAHAVNFDHDDNGYLKKAELEDAAKAWTTDSTEEANEEEVVNTEEETAESQEKVCPVCSANTPADAITCASCGWTFES
ncbi:MAG: hypothetical protein ISP82_07780 [Candidatus Poseidoniaceae archaeon]|nr:hypothetical protein [Candidatus Poseidoniaceae archaeon]